MRTKRREIEGISLSFLDVISCGFGALILLLVLTKVFDPVVIDEDAQDLSQILTKLQEELHETRGEAMRLNREMVRKEDIKEDEAERLQDVSSNLASLKGAFQASVTETEITAVIEGQLADARQSLSEEMARLLAEYKPDDDSLIGGIPVDSEYIVFIIDNSGSMQFAWPLVKRKIEETLDIHPVVKGIQVMNDMGTYMFRRTAGEWIADTPALRRRIMQAMDEWDDFSNSSPVEGINKAISTYYKPGRRISLYVFGDDFRGRSFQRVVDTVDRLNNPNLNGDRLVRIHGIGFPNWFTASKPEWVYTQRFAILMTTLSERNGGTFVGLTDLRTF